MSHYSKNDALKKLKEAKEHLDLEIISQDEYDELKNELKHFIIGEEKEDLYDDIDNDSNTKSEFQLPPKLSKSEIQNSGHIRSFGTIKRFKLFSKGFTIRGLKTNIYHSWEYVESVDFLWDHTVINALGHNHILDVGIQIKNGNYISETFAPNSMYIDLSSRFIKKLISDLCIIAEEKSFKVSVGNQNLV